MAYMNAAELNALREKARQRLHPQRRVQDVVDFIENNYLRDIDTNTLKDVFGSHSTFMFTSFKAAGLPSPMQLLFKRRVQHMRESIEKNPYQNRLAVWREVQMFPGNKQYLRYEKEAGEKIQDTFEKALKKAKREERKQSKEKEN